MSSEKHPSIETLLAHLGEDRSAYDGAVVPPVFQNSLFTFGDWDEIDAAFTDRLNRPIYTRQLNPTQQICERKIAALATHSRIDLDARLFASGMAAISAAVLSAVSAGDHVIAVKNVYGPTNNLLNTYLREKMGIETTFVGGTEIEEFSKAITSQTKLIILESPSTAVFSLQNIAQVAELAKANNITTLIDNTWATPVFQKPLDLGIDLEVHSASKYLGGHSDIVAGVVISSQKRIREIIVKEGELLGGIVAPWTAWLLTRSLRTLSMRLERHQKNALAVAGFLDQHPNVRSVRYPGLESHPQHKLSRQQMTGYTGLLGFELDSENVDSIKRVFNSLQYFQIGVSWGGHESLIYAPAISYLKELPPERFHELGITLGDMRISVGLEDTDDLIEDLTQALAKL